MLNFAKIEKENIALFSKYYDKESALGCDMNMLNAYLWRDVYNIKFAVFNDDTLIKAYFNDDGTIWGYCLPLGREVDNAVKAIMNDANERNEELMLCLLTNGQRAHLENSFPSVFSYVRTPENQDYIYTTKDLVTLQGKKYHAKRNHIAKFRKAYPDSRFETIDENNVSDALTVTTLWCKENGYDIDNYNEAAIIKEALSHMQEFKMSGAILYVDNRPVAMTLGSEISKKAYDINFEKGLREYDGVYAVINNEFAKTLTKYEYINREEDMGLDGLRKSKLSYNPIIIYDRYNAKFK